ncbi:histone deacetylase [Streptomyces sp. NPDC085481]|uniref:histone deacetylase n=1 Tax=Streptomyces sp. NPDC085481 TaxID=3365727 RepID=UPI0037D3F801
MLPGVVHFATESVVWGGGGRAFYDPGGEGLVLGRAFLVTAGQFSDIAAQEMYRQPGQDLDLAAVVARGRVEFGPGRYETVVCAGEMDGVPLLTFTAPWGVGDVESRPPSVAYLRHIVAGLREAGDWEGEEIAAYLGACPGVAGRWTAGDLLRLLP